MQRTTNGNLPSAEDVAQVFRRLSDRLSDGHMIVPVRPSEARDHRQVASVIGGDGMSRAAQMQLARRVQEELGLLSLVRASEGGDAVLERAYELWSR
jgi:hypothetical protein